MNHMQPQRTPGHGERRYFHTATVTDTTSDALIVPSVGRDASVSVTPGTDAKVQYTLSSYDDIEADTATWHDWPAGAATEKTADSITGAASALRLVSTGASTWEITV